MCHSRTFQECVNNNIVGLIASESIRLKECETATSAALDSIDRDKHLRMRAYCSKYCRSDVSRTTTIDDAINITSPTKTDAATPAATEADTTDAENRPSTDIEPPTTVKFKYPTPTVTPTAFTRYRWSPPRIGKWEYRILYIYKMRFGILPQPNFLCVEKATGVDRWWTSENTNIHTLDALLMSSLLTSRWTRLKIRQSRSGLPGLSPACSRLFVFIRRKTWVKKYFPQRSEPSQRSHSRGRSAGSICIPSGEIGQPVHLKKQRAWNEIMTAVSPKDKSTRQTGIPLASIGKPSLTALQFHVWGWQPHQSHQGPLHLVRWETRFPKTEQDSLGLLEKSCRFRQECFIKSPTVLRLVAWKSVVDLHLNLNGLDPDLYRPRLYSF